MTRIRQITLVATALAVLIWAPSAQADYQQAIRDCAGDGALHRHYTRQELLQALAHLPTDIKEYTDCYDVLNRQLNGGTSAGRGGLATTNPALITASGAVAGSPRDLKSLAAALRDHLRPPRVIHGSGGFFQLASRTAQNKLPQPLLISLIAIAVMGALAGLLALRHRWPETRRVALRIFRR